VLLSVDNWDCKVVATELYPSGSSRTRNEVGPDEELAEKGAWQQHEPILVEFRADGSVAVEGER